MEWYGTLQAKEESNDLIPISGISSSTDFDDILDTYWSFFSSMCVPRVRIPNKDRLKSLNERGMCFLIWGSGFSFKIVCHAKLG